MASPLHQFEIQPIVPIELGGIDISITNSALWMAIAAVTATAVMVLPVRRGALIPGRWQALSESFYEIIANMVRDNVGTAGRRYFPFVFTLFMFVLFGNVLGLIPYTFTYTSHIAVTFSLAAFIFLAVTAIGIAKHGFRFLGLFFPHGAPAWTAVILIPIELISYLSRPVSLSVRLFANMTVGHVILKVLGGFVVSLGAFYAIPGLLPMAGLVAVTALEVMVAVIQAYIFTILTCIYLNDALHLH